MRIKNGTKKFDVHWQRIETSTALGVPDLNGSYDGEDAWIELKVFTGNKFRSKFTGPQAAWHVARTKVHGQSWIWALDPRDDSIHVWDGWDALALHKCQGLLTPSHEVFTKPYDWSTILQKTFNQEKP